MNPLEVTEILLAGRPWTGPSRGLCVNPPSRPLSFHGRLFQASMWRKYAAAWKYDREYIEQVLRITKADALRRARVNIYLARRLNRHSLASQ